MSALREIFTRVQSVARTLIALCMILMMVVIFLQTTMRYVVFYSLPWSEELSRYLYVALTLIGLNLAMTQKQLVRIDIIDNYVSPAMLLLLNKVRSVLTVIITVVFFYSSFGMIDVSQFQHSPAMGISMQIMYVILGTGFFLSAAAAIFELCDAFKSSTDASGTKEDQ